MIRNYVHSSIDNTKIATWDSGIITDKKYKFYHYDRKSAHEYVKNVMPLTYKMLNSNKILENSIVEHSVLKNVERGNNSDTLKVLNMIKEKLEINKKRTPNNR
jgi:hypothetical protein